MSSAVELLERALYRLENAVISERQERSIKIIALHIIDLCGASHMSKQEQTKLLLEMLDDCRER